MGALGSLPPKVPTASEREVELSVGSRFLLGDIIILCKSGKTVVFLRPKCSYSIHDATPEILYRGVF